ncbi:MAG: hypothetical protein AAF590_05685 [Pseudomonadota bacterium]
MAARTQTTITPVTIMITMIRIALAGFLLAGLSSQANAQTVEECDWRTFAAALAEPWEEKTRTFANGEVRLAVTDTVEPAAGAFHLMILSPPFDELGTRQCRVVSADGSIGFAGLTLSGMTSAYDPTVGLTFTFEAGAYDPETGGTLPRALTVTLNQATGDIRARLQGGK